MLPGRIAAGYSDDLRKIEHNDQVTIMFSKISAIIIYRILLAKEPVEYF